MIGLEPITCWLQISCSANWATSAYILQVTPTGIEPVLPPWKGDVLTAWPRSQKTPPVGLEPTTTRLTAECSTDWAKEDYSENISSVYISSKLHTNYWLSFHLFCSYHLTWLCPRPISNSQLHVLLHFHLCPIYLVVFKGSYNFRWDISSWGGLHA